LKMVRTTKKGKLGIGTETHEMEKRIGGHVCHRIERSQERPGTEAPRTGKKNGYGDTR